MQMTIFGFGATVLLILAVTGAQAQGWRNCAQGSIGPGGCESIGPGGGRSTGPGGGLSIGPGGGLSIGPGGGQSVGPGGGLSIGPGGGLALDRNPNRGLDTRALPEIRYPAGSMYNNGGIGGSDDDYGDDE